MKLHNRTLYAAAGLGIGAQFGFSNGHNGSTGDEFGDEEDYRSKSAGQASKRGERGDRRERRERQRRKGGKGKKTPRRRFEIVDIRPTSSHPLPFPTTVLKFSLNQLLPSLISTALLETLLDAQRESELELHTPTGPVLQLLGVIQRPGANVGHLLRTSPRAL